MVNVKKSIMGSSLLIIVVTLTMCTSYQSDDNLTGKYGNLSNSNTHDTILLLKTGRYERNIYDKSHNFIKKFEGTYSFNGEENLVLNNFFMNQDRDLVKYLELLNDTYGYFEISINSNSQSLFFCTGYEDDYCYQKVSN